MGSVTKLHPEPPRCRYGFTKEEAARLMEDLVLQDERILPVAHAYQRMEEREVTITQVVRVLRRGAIVHGPSLGPERMWRSKYRADCSGQDISVVVDLDQDHMGNMIAVVTVIDHS